MILAHPMQLAELFCTTMGPFNNISILSEYSDKIGSVGGLRDCSLLWLGKLRERKTLEMLEPWEHINQSFFSAITRGFQLCLCLPQA
jgi:hypothetical protein